MPAALTPPWKLHTPIREPPWEPAVMREKAAAAAAAQRSSRIISIGTPSRPSALFTRQTGKVETQPTPSCLRMRLMPVATSIVMDVVSFAWSRAVSLRGRTKAYKHTMISRVPFPVACRNGDRPQQSCRGRSCQPLVRRLGVGVIVGVAQHPAGQSPGMLAVFHQDLAIDDRRHDAGRRLLHAPAAGRE